MPCSSRSASRRSTSTWTFSSDERSNALLIQAEDQQYQQILALLTEDEDASPAAWFWLTMNDEERTEKFAELLDWVETVLRAQYPDYLADQIRPCWPNHPEARWELAWLYQQQFKAAEGGEYALPGPPVGPGHMSS